MRVDGTSSYALAATTSGDGRTRTERAGDGGATGTGRVRGSGTDSSSRPSARIQLDDDSALTMADRTAARMTADPTAGLVAQGHVRLAGALALLLS